LVARSWLRGGKRLRIASAALSQWRPEIVCSLSSWWDSAWGLFMLWSWVSFKRLTYMWFPYSIVPFYEKKCVMGVKNYVGGIVAMCEGF
jgi:hypothetical protein